MLDCPLITADRRLAQRARDTGHVRLLARFDVVDGLTRCCGEFSAP